MNEKARKKHSSRSKREIQKGTFKGRIAIKSNEPSRSLLPPKDLLWIDDLVSPQLFKNHFIP